MDSATAAWIRFSMFQLLAILREPGIQLNTSTTTQASGKKMPSSLSSVLWNGRLLDELGSMGKKFGCFWLVVPSKELAPS